MMEGSSLRMMVGMYSAFGTLEEISCRGQGKSYEVHPAAKGGGSLVMTPYSAVTKGRAL